MLVIGTNYFKIASENTNDSSLGTPEGVQVNVLMLANELFENLSLIDDKNY